jgi:hypothetical protein
MKKILLFVTAVLFMAACDMPTENLEAPYGGNSGTTVFQTILIDSCEYIIGYERLAHKGNCKYCAERRKQEFKELVKQIKEE